MKIWSKIAVLKHYLRDHVNQNISRAAHKSTSEGLCFALLTKRKRGKYQLSKVFYNTYKKHSSLEEILVLTAMFVCI